MKVQITHTTREAPVPLAGGFAVPRRFTARIGEVMLMVETSPHGEPRVTELTLRPADGMSLRAEDLRRVPLARYLRAAVTAATMRVRDSGKLSPVRETDIGDLYAAYRPPRGAPRPRLTDEQLARAVEVYREALRAGDPPTRTVADVLDLERSTAGRWIVEARRRGLLGPALPRQAGEATKGKEKR